MSFRATLLATLALAVLAATALAAPARPRVSVVGDSVPAALDFSPAARAVLRRGLSARLDLRVCRRLVAPSCPYQGSTPSTALQAVRALGAGVGDVLVVDVGYNDTAAGYGSGMRRIVSAARRQGARAVVWVTLRQAGRYRSEYVRTNAVIRAEAARAPSRIIVADWNAYTAGKGFFVGDGLHLTATGAMSLARFLRPAILRAAR
jgi:hypothetical protein